MCVHPVRLLRLIFMVMALIAFGVTHPWVMRYKQRILPDDVKNRRSLSFSSIQQNGKYFPFNQLIFSWNAVRPEQGFFRFLVRVRDAHTKKWLSWHKMYEWGANIQRSFKGDDTGDGVQYLFVRLELVQEHPADGFEIKIEPFEGASLSNLKLVSATVARLHEMEPEIAAQEHKKLTSVHIKGVPKRSQLQLDHPHNTKICSPTSTSMLVSYLTGKHVDPLKFAQWAYDAGLGVYGSWPFNVAHAYEHVGEKYHFSVTRLRSFKELHKFLRRNLPVVVSVRGEIKGAPKPYPSGHLLIVVGYDARNGNVICHDPAHKEDKLTLSRYTLQDFLAAWERSHRLAYITEPA